MEQKRRVDSYPAASTSTSDARPKLVMRPEDLKQLNDSVWEFYKHPHQVPKVEVLFFHGAQLTNDKEAFWKTWLSRDETIVWPNAWLAEQFPESRMLFISYDSSVLKSSGQKDTFQILENLMQDIIWSSNSKIGQNCPVILVGHCFGGIIIKNFLVKCSQFPCGRHRGDLKVKETELFLQNCKAIFCYSTPNEGSRLTDGLPFIDSILGNVNQSIVDFLKELSKHTARINTEFSTLRHSRDPDKKLAIYMIAETLETKLRNFGPGTTMVVPESSARHDVDFVYWASADHFEVSRANNNSTCIIFTGLRDLIADNYNISSSSMAESALDFSDDEHYVPLEKTISDVDKAFKKAGVVILHGDSGMGKSSLARHFALRFEKKQAQEASSSSGSPLWPVVVFVTCGKEAKVTDTQEELLVMFKADYPRKDWSKLGENAFQRQLRLKLQSHLVDRQALVVLDDVWEKKLVENVLVRGSKLKYLITTRNRDLWPHNAEVIEIEGVDMQHGRRILAKYAECKDNELIEGQADKLIKEVQFHPLALASLGTVLQPKKTKRDWQHLTNKFLDYLKSDDESYHPIVYDRSYPRSLRAAMMLMVEGLDDASRTTLHAINIFAGKRIAESLVELFLSSTLPDVFESFHLKIKNLERLSLVRRQPAVFYQDSVYFTGWAPKLFSTEDGKADEDASEDCADLSSDVFVIHDLRRKFLSEDKSSTTEILRFLSVDREGFLADPDMGSKYDLATVLCAVCGQNYVTEAARTHLPIPNCLWADGWFMKNFDSFMRGSVFSRLVTSTNERTSSSTAAIKVLLTFVAHHKIDLDNLSLLLMTLESNRRAIELVYVLLRMTISLVKGSTTVTYYGPRFESSRKIIINIGEFWERLIQLLSSNVGAKFQSVALLSILHILVSYSVEYPERISIADLMGRMAVTNLLNMLFVYLDKIDEQRSSRCSLSLKILKVFLDVRPSDLPCTVVRDNLAAQIISANNLRILARLVIQGPNELIDQTMKILQAIIDWGNQIPGVTEGLLKNAVQELFDTTSLCETILRRHFLPQETTKVDTDKRVDTDVDTPTGVNTEADTDMGVGGQGGFSNIEREETEEDLEARMEEYKLQIAFVDVMRGFSNIERGETEEDVEARMEEYKLHLAFLKAMHRVNEEENWAEHKVGMPKVREAAQALVEFAAIHFPSRLLDRSTTSLLQDLELGHNDYEYISFVVMFAQIPHVAFMIVNQDLLAGCLEKLVGLLNDTVEEEFQSAALRALYVLTSAKKSASTPDYEIQIKLLETEHLLERVIMSLSERPDMKRRCVWAAHLLKKLVLITDSHTLQGPFFLSLASKAQHFHMCLERVEKLVVEGRSQVIGLEVLLSIAHLAFKFNQSENRILIDGSAISSVLRSAVKFLKSDLKIFRGILAKLPASMAQSTSGERLRLKAEGFTQMFITSGRLEEFEPGFERNTVSRSTLKSLAIIPKFRFVARLRQEVEDQMQMLTTSDLLETLAMTLSKKTVRSITLGDDSCLLAVQAIRSLATVPAFGEFIARFHDGNHGLIIEGLLGLLENVPLISIDLMGRVEVEIIQTQTVDALLRLPVRKEVEARLQTQPIAPGPLRDLYSGWSRNHVVHGDHQSALTDLNRALELAWEIHDKYLHDHQLLRERMESGASESDLHTRILMLYMMSVATGASRGLDMMKPEDNRHLLLRERGVLRNYMEDLQGALGDLDQAMEIGGGLEYICLKHRGWVKYKLGDEEGARKDAEKVIEIWPSGIRHGFPDDGFPDDGYDLLSRSVEFLEYKLT